MTLSDSPDPCDPPARFRRAPDWEMSQHTLEVLLLEGSLDDIRQALAAGGNPNMRSDTDHTPLSTAVVLHSYEAIPTLVAAGADLTFTRTGYFGNTELEDLTLVEILICDWHDLSLSHKEKSRYFALKTLDTLIELGAPTA